MIALQSLISLSLLLVLLYLYGQYRVDKFREEIFSLREELFLKARAGDLSFESHGYLYARAVLNGLVRYAHELSIVDFVVFGLVVPKELVEARREKARALASAMSEADRRICGEFLAAAHRRVVLHMASAPIVLVTIVLPITFFVLSKVGVDWAGFAIKRLKKPMRSLDELAVAVPSEPCSATFA